MTWLSGQAEKIQLYINIYTCTATNQQMRGRPLAKQSKSYPGIVFSLWYCQEEEVGGGGGYGLLLVPRFSELYIKNTPSLQNKSDEGKNPSFVNVSQLNAAWHFVLWLSKARLVSVPSECLNLTPSVPVVLVMIARRRYSEREEVRADLSSINTSSNELQQPSWCSRT